MYKIILRRQAEPEAKTSFKMCLHFKRGFYDIGNFVPYIIKTLREDAHSREEEVCRKAAALGARMCRGTFFL